MALDKLFRRRVYAASEVKYVPLQVWCDKKKQVGWIHQFSHSSPHKVLYYNAVGLNILHRVESERRLSGRAAIQSHPHLTTAIVLTVLTPR